MARHTGKDALTHFLLDIRGIANGVAKKYPGVEADDLFQGLAEWLLKHGHRLKLEETKGCKYILNRTAHILAGESRAEALGKSVQYSYKVEDVRKILETTFCSPEVWFDSYVPEDAVSLRYGTDSLDVTFDVQQALLHMTSEEYKLIFKAYAIGDTPANASAERKRLERAVQKLTDQLNSFEALRKERKRFIGGPGSRRVISNAAARSTISTNGGSV